jgi:hypothetical protein
VGIPWPSAMGRMSTSYLLKQEMFYLILSFETIFDDAFEAEGIAPTLESNEI